MPSVIVSWSGRCEDASLRAELCDKLEEIASVSDRFMRAGAGVKRFDQQIGRKILLAGTVLEVGDLKQALDAEKSLERRWLRAIEFRQRRAASLEFFKVLAYCVDNLR
jgi:hypothetical protein